MLVGVISDTHLLGEPVPEPVMQALAGSEMILHAGDIVEMAVLQQLSTIAETFAVHGNMDHGDTARLLPARRTVEAHGFRIGLTHGHGPPSGIVERVAAEFDHVDCIVFGHTHNPVVETRGGVLFFNPGSPTDRMFASRNTVGFLEITDIITPRIVDLDAGREEQH